MAEFALLDPREQTDRADGMLVDGEVVIHVELHLRVDPAEFGHEPPEHAGFVEPAQHRLGIPPARQDIEEQRVGAAVAAHVGLDQPGIARDQPQRLGVDRELLAVGNRENLDQPDRIMFEPVAGGRAQLSALDLVALDLARLGPEPREQALRLAGEALVELREEHAGEVADHFRLQEKILHEPLDRAFARPVGKIHPRGDLALEVEGQAILGAVAGGVKVAAYRPEEILGAAEGAQFRRRQQPDVDQFARLADLVDIFADPVERVQIAQAALALLDVGLDHVATVAQALVPFVALGQFLGDELTLGPFDDVLPESRLGFLVEPLVTPDVPAFEHRRADRQVRFAHPHHFIERAARVADLEIQVPEEIQHRLDHLLAPVSALAGREERDVDIGVRRHFAAAVAAHREHREPLPGRAVAHGIDRADHVIMDDPHELVDQERLRLCDFVAGGRRVDQPPLDFVATLRQRPGGGSPRSPAEPRLRPAPRRSRRCSRQSPAG